MLLDELKALYPDFSPEDLIVAKEILDQYLLLAWEIFEASERKSSSVDSSDSESYASGKVDSQQT